MRNEKGQFVEGAHWREPQAFRDKDWLVDNYVRLQRSASEIASEFGVTDNAILFWLHRHDIPRRTVAEARAIKHWGQVGADNPMWNRRGELNPRWMGGITPARQSFYASAEWKSACSAVWSRDKATCRRCQMQRGDSPDMPFHIHHIVSFADELLRAEPANLVLLCETCHHFVHSRRNVNREHLSEV